MATVQAPGGSSCAHKEIFRRIRLLRKKLKQIDYLKLVSRKLNEEEQIKMSKEGRVRADLTELLQKQKNLQNELRNSGNSSNNDDDPDEVSNVNTDFKPGGVNQSQRSKPPEETVDEKQSPTPVKKLRTEESSLHQADSPTNVHHPGPSLEAEVTQPKPPAVSTKPNPVNPTATMKQKWNNVYLELVELVGHSDLVLSVDITDYYIVSGSRDTTIKVWETSSGNLLHNLGGHTGAVNCVLLVHVVADDQEKTTACVSGSEDCSLRLWDVSTGEELCNIYLYNSIKSLAYMPESSRLVAGLEGGKLEIFDLNASMQKLMTHTVDTDGISALSVDGTIVTVGGADGAVFVLDIADTSVRCLYQLENENISCVESIAYVNDLIVVGDDQSNMKVINWKKNEIASLANHHVEFGKTDAMCVLGDKSCLLSSAYNYDVGCGYINVRDLKLGRFTYLTSFSDSDIKHILSIASVLLPSQHRSDEMLTLVTGGLQLVLWKQQTDESTEYAKAQSKKLVLVEDNFSSDSEDYDANDSESESQTEDDIKGEATSTSWWWCSLL